MHRAESLNHIEREDLYRLQRLYQYDEDEKYQTRLANESLLNSNASNVARMNSSSMHLNK